MAYCSRVCQYHDWKKRKYKCVFWRVREWQRRLLLDGTPLPDCHVRIILSYALAPPLPARTRRVEQMSDAAS